MNMDNRVFNVNGSGSDGLLKTLELAFMQAGRNTSCTGWFQTKEHGLVLCWVDGAEVINSLPAPLNASQCLSFVEQWLQGDFAKDVELSDWCGNADHDGHNSDGWQVYCEDWGHVASKWEAICGIKPSYCWHGK